MAWKQHDEVEIMTPELEKALAAIDKHLDKQDELHDATVKAFMKHELDDVRMHGRIEVHLDEAERERKFKMALTIALITGIIAAIGDFVLHLVRK